MTSASSIVRLSRKASKPWLWWFHLVVLLTVIQFQAQASSSSIECILLATHQFCCIQSVYTCPLWWARMWASLERRPGPSLSSIAPPGPARFPNVLKSFWLLCWPKLWSLFMFLKLPPFCSRLFLLLLMVILTFSTWAETLWQRLFILCSNLI